MNKALRAGRTSITTRDILNEPGVYTNIGLPEDVTDIIALMRGRNARFGKTRNSVHGDIRYLLNLI